MGCLLKTMFALRAALLSYVGLLAFAGAAQAERAPIVYAGQGGATSSAPVAALEGGGENSYGYGSTARAREGAVIDIRRNGSSAARVTPVVDQGVPLTIEEEPTQPTQPAPATNEVAEEGAQPWLERERVGPPYEANGQWYVPTPEPGYEQTGTASWYGPTFHGQRTASGEVFDQEALTAAHPTLPIPSLVQVTNLENGREIIVRVNDRGPFVGGRLIDLSRGAAEALDFEQAGHARVHVRYLGPAPRRVNADGSSAAPSPASPPPAPVNMREQEGPRSLLPAPSSAPVLAGGLEDDDAPYAPAPPSYASAGGFYVQVGAYSDLTNAHRVRDAVEAAGPVVVDIRQTATGELFRVRVGPWGSREDAEAARRTLVSLGYGETIVAAR
jgi:rare lipoprotein A